MAEPIAIAPIYASGDLSQILAVEQRQIEDTIADLTDEQMRWRPRPKLSSAGPAASGQTWQSGSWTGVARGPERHVRRT